MSNEYLIGQKILGYELEELIGSGGFGKVYKGVKKLGKDKYYAAIKHISLPKNNEYNDLLNSMGRNYEAVDKYYEKILDDMVNEINTLFYLSKKDNKNIVTYYDHDIVKQENPLKYDIFIRMEYLKPLNIYSNEGNMTVEDAINLGIDIARALDNCHNQGIIHRDVKDGNIFISEDGYFKLGDFGISRMLSDTNQTLSMKGTPIFMAPEVILGKYYDKTVDIYSLGIVLYKLLNYNRIPFLPKYPEIYTSRDTDIAMNRRLSGEKFDNPQNASDELGQVILRACEIQGNRYGSCEELISDLIKVKNNMSEDKLSKLLFEVDDEKSKSDKHNDLEDTYILTQNDMDDTVLLDNLFEECQDNVEDIINDSVCESCLDNSIDDTVILEYDNDVDLSESELIDNTVVISESVDILEENIENLTNKNEYKSNKVFFIGIAIISSVCLALAVGDLYLKKSENTRIEQLKANLPKTSSKLGCLPGNLATLNVFTDNPPYIVTSKGVPFFKEESELGLYDENSGEFKKLTNTEGKIGPKSFNRYGDFIYYIGAEGDDYKDDYKVQKYNTITKEISDVYGIYATQIIIMGDYMYYIEEKFKDHTEENYRLFKLNLIDGSKEKILNLRLNMFSINSDYILYKRASSTHKSIYLMNLETKEITTLDIETDWRLGAEWVALYENCILYIDKNDKSLYRVNLNENNIDTESKEMIQENVYDFTLEGQYLYFIEGDCTIEDGSSKLLVKDLISNDIYYIDDNATYINVDGGYMQYYRTDDGPYMYKFLPEEHEKVNE